MKNIFKLLGITLLLTGIAQAEPVQNVQSPSTSNVNTTVATKHSPAITVGLPLNVTGVSLANRPDILNFATINTDNTVEINWKNVCALTSSHKLNIQNDLSNFKGEEVIYLLPYMLENSNPAQCKKGS